MKAAEVERDIESLEPEVQQAYLDQIAGTVKRISIQELDDALQQGDESRIEELLALGLFALLALRLRAIYTRGSTKELEGIRIPGIRKEIDPSAPSVNGFLSGQSSTIQQQAQAEQIAAIRAAIAAGAIRGDSTRAIALNIAGRISRQTGVRSGGVVGLSGAAAKAVESARDQLASGDPAQLKEYLKRARRDRAFDSVVKASIETGKPIAQATINRAAGSYAERLLTTQAETIAQTNTAEAYNKGREEGWRQLTDRSNGLYTFLKTWKTRGDNKVRENHIFMNGQTVTKDEPFVSPSGAMLLFPCDSSLGAPMKERARCRCVAEYSLKKNEQVVR